MNKPTVINSEALTRYYDVMKRSLGAYGIERVQHQMELQYENIDFGGLRVLDIGGGNGIHAFYAAASGAEEVVVIEPEEAGSTAGVTTQFEIWQQDLACHNVQLLKTTLQEYDPVGKTFDVIIIQDAINHIAEEACVNLLMDVQSRRIFEQAFLKIASLGHPGTVLHFSDCSSRNFFPTAGLTNPFDPGIEWEKHQPPGVWIAMLDQVGFEVIRRRWSTPTRLGKVGRLVARSGLFAYFFTSHFIVTMKMR